MKRGTPRHKKMFKLAEYLGVCLPHAVGIMEMLWHFAATACPEGDLGSIPDSAIAEAVGWKQPDELLVAGLIKSGWLDLHSVHRFIVHDWPEHCEQSVKKWLDRNHKTFLPEYSRHPSAGYPPDIHCPDAVYLSREAGQGRAKASEVLTKSEPRKLLEPLPIDPDSWDSEQFRKNFKEIWRGTATVLEIGCTTAMQDCAVSPDPPGVALRLTESARKWVCWYKARGINRNLVDWLKEDSMSDPPEIRHAPGSKAARDAEMDQMARARGLIT